MPITDPRKPITVEQLAQMDRDHEAQSIVALSLRLRVLIFQHLDRVKTKGGVSRLDGAHVDRLIETLDPFIEAHEED